MRYRISEDIFKKEIECLDRQNKMLLAWLEAGRALPFLECGNNFLYWGNSRYWHLYSIFLAIDCAAFIYQKNTALKNGAAELAFLFAFDAADILDSWRIPSYTVKAAAYGVITASDTVNNRTEEEVTDSAVWAAINAAKAAAAYDIDLKDIILRDTLCIQKDGDLRNVTRGVNMYGKIWDCFSHTLQAVHCKYWADLYRNIFADGFLLDKASLSRRMNVPEQICTQGAAVVGEYLSVSQST